jgi:hypothetical protein
VDAIVKRPTPAWLLAVDPSVTATGMAVFEAGVLAHARLVENRSTKSIDDWRSMAWGVFYAVHFPSSGDAVIEIPQVYRRGPGDPNDLVTLAGVAGAIATVVPPVIHLHSVVPAEWKGQVPKPKRASDPYIIEDRVRARLSPEELSRVQLPSARSLQHNVWDACGLGMWHLGRY